MFYYQKPLLFNLAIGALLVCVAALIPLGMGVYMLAMNQRAKSFVTTQGTITRVEVFDAEGAVTFKYKYSVDGTEYSSNQVCFGPDNSSPSQERLEGWIKKFPEGSRATVYYNPSDHGEAILDQGDGGLAMVFLLIPLVAGPIGFVLISIKISWFWHYYGKPVRKEMAQQQRRRRKKRRY